MEHVISQLSDYARTIEHLSELDDTLRPLIEKSFEKDELPWFQSNLPGYTIAYQLTLPSRGSLQAQIRLEINKASNGTPVKREELPNVADLEERARAIERESGILVTLG